MKLTIIPDWRFDRRVESVQPISQPPDHRTEWHTGIHTEINVIITYEAAGDILVLIKAFTVMWVTSEYG